DRRGRPAPPAMALACLFNARLGEPPTGKRVLTPFQSRGVLKRQRHPSVALAYRVGSRAEMLGLDVEADGPGLRIEAHRLAGEGIGVCLPERPAERGRHVL